MLELQKVIGHNLADNSCQPKNQKPSFCSVNDFAVDTNGQTKCDPLLESHEHQRLNAEKFVASTIETIEKEPLKDVIFYRPDYGR